MLAATLLGVCTATFGAQTAHAATAITPSGTITFADETTQMPFTNGGKSTSPIQVTTSGGCSNPGTTDDLVDGYNATVLGPGAFAANPAAGRANGLVVIGTIDVGLSTTSPITAPFRATFQDFAGELKTTIVPGDYVVTFNCINQFDQITFQTYAGTIHFSSATDFTVTGVPSSTDSTTTTTTDPAATTTTDPAATTTTDPATTTTTDPATTTTDTSDTDTSATSATDTSATSASGTTDTSATDTSATSATDTTTTTTVTSTVASSSGDPTKLAYTGSPLDTIVPTGVVLVVAGLLLLRAGRRRGLRG